MDQLDSQTFPEFFSSVNPHMVLLSESTTQWHLLPPNQTDWVYSLTMLSGTMWSVYGIKEDVDFGVSEYKAVYKFKNGMWTAGRDSLEALTWAY